MKFQLVMFDSDGTLADTLPWMRSVFNDLADEHGFRRVPADDFERMRDLHGSALLDELDLPIWKLPRVVSAMRKRMAAHNGTLAAFNGVPGMLEKLREAGAQLAVVSSNSRVNVERVLGPEVSGLIHHFACGVSMFGKAARLREVVRASRLAKQSAIYIGDEIRDAEAARKAGVAFGAVAWGQHSEQALRAQNPAEFFNSVDEVAEKLA